MIKMLETAPDKETEKWEELQQRYSSFLSMTTHDLMAPLRKLGVLTDRLVEKFELVGDEEVKQFTLRIHSCLEEMRAVINGCRQIAESVPDAMNLENFHSTELIKETLEEFATQMKESGAEVNLSEELPLIRGDRSQLKDLFRELIKNSLVFTRKDSPPKLEISSGSQEGNPEIVPIGYVGISFSDNGIGFSKEEAERIFYPTVRLHGKSAYPGNGFGLTLAKRIMTNHGGTIIADGQEGSGSRFILLFPKTQA